MPQNVERNVHAGPKLHPTKQRAQHKERAIGSLRVDNVAKLVHTIRARIEANVGDGFEAIAIGTTTLGKELRIGWKQLMPIPQIGGEIVTGGK